MKNTLFFAAVIFALDQLTKIYVVQVLNLKSVGAISVFPPYLNFHMAWNKGVNFGLFADNSNLLRWLLAGFAVAVSLWLLRWAGTLTSKRLHVFFGFIIGGAIGNAFDRLIYGAVADFLNMSCCGINNPFAFNVADIAIFIGAFGLVLFSNKDQNST